MRKLSGQTIAVLFISLVILTLSQGCAKKSRKAGGGGGSSMVSGQEMYPPGGGGGSLSEEELQREHRDPSFAEAPTGALQDVYFEFDRSDLSDDSRRVIEANADWIKSNPGMKVQVEGHCDERGTEEYNLALGERRATAVKNYLVSLGVDAAKLFTISYGEELPLDPGHGEEAWVKNRRAHFVATSANF